MRLKEVMTRDVDVIRPESTLVEAARKMKNLDVGPIPVCDDNEILGMITDRDITTRAVAEGRDPGRTQVREVMTPDVLYCFEDQDVSEAARLMQQRQVRRILVLNRNREVAGIVSLGDIAVETGDSKLAAKTLEQVSADSDREPLAARLHSNRQTAQSLRATERSATIAAEHDFAGAGTSLHEYSHTQPRARDLTGRKTVAGLFPDRRSAERAMEDLKQAGFRSEQIGIVMRDTAEGRKPEHHKETHAAEGAMTGVLGGGVLGGVAGYLIAIGALAIPGVGPVLVGGAVAQALGVIAGTAAVGAGIGAAAGGLVGVLVGMGIPEDEARHFERRFGHEQALVTVKAGDRLMEALAILEMNDADTGLGRVAKH
jgi:CBS domain-containing protein